MIGYYDVYKVGQFNGQGPILYMFRFYRPDGSFGSCQCVEEAEGAKTRDAIIAMGYKPLPKNR